MPSYKTPGCETQIENVTYWVWYWQDQGDTNQWYQFGDVRALCYLIIDIFYFGKIGKLL